MGVVGERIMVIGGVDQDFRCVDTTYIYDTSTDTWTEGPRLRIARKSAAGFYYDRKVYVCGGTNDHLKFLDSSEVYDDLTGEWTSIQVPFKNWKSLMVAVNVNKPVR